MLERSTIGVSLGSTDKLVLSSDEGVKLGSTDCNLLVTTLGGDNVYTLGTYEEFELGSSNVSFDGSFKGFT